MTTARRADGLTEWPLMAAALAFLIAYAALVLARPAGTALVVTELVMWGTWLLFAVDFVVRLVLAEQRGRWVLTHWYEGGDHAAHVAAAATAPAGDDGGGDATIGGHRCARPGGTATTHRSPWWAGRSPWD